MPDDGRRPAGFDYAHAVRQGARLKVASKYVNIAREHFAAKGVHVDLIKLYGSMELAPLAGLADAIVDLVSTGSTLKANNLLAVEHIMDISSRLDRQSGRTQAQARALAPILEAIAGVLQQMIGIKRLPAPTATSGSVSTPCWPSRRRRTSRSRECVAGHSCRCQGTR
jgi:ATP phosphoribosyltransferase